MSEYFDNLKKYFDIKISLYSLLIATIISLIGFWIYPNVTFHYSLMGVFLLFAAMTPILIIWKLYDLSNRLKNKFLHLTISIWIGLFFAFIIPHQIITKIGELEWKRAAHETDMTLDHFHTYHGYYPENMEILLEWMPQKERLILNRYLDLIQIKFTYTTNEADSNNKYELMTGFWIADLRLWNPNTKEWNFVF